MALTPEQQNELAATIAANRERQIALAKDKEEGVPEITLRLVRSPDDPPQFSSEVQAEMRTLNKALRDAGIKTDMPFMTMDAVDASGGYVGQIITQAINAVPTLATIIVAWLHGRSGRKVTVEFYASGKPKRIEAQTPEQIASILETSSREAEPRPKQ